MMATHEDDGDSPDADLLRLDLLALAELIVRQDRIRVELGGKVREEDAPLIYQSMLLLRRYGSPEQKRIGGGVA